MSREHDLKVVHLDTFCAYKSCLMYARYNLCCPEVNVCMLFRRLLFLPSELPYVAFVDVLSCSDNSRVIFF